MNLKPLIKALKVSPLQAVPLLVPSSSDQPPGSSERRGFQPADQGGSWGGERLWGGCGVNGRLGRPRPLEQRAGSSQTGHDKWLCMKTESKPKQTAPKKTLKNNIKKISVGCFEESIYQGVSLKVTTCGSRHGSIHCWMNTAITLPEENIFSPNNFLERFFCLLVCWSLSSRNYAKEEANEAEWSVLAPLFCITRQQPSKSPLPSAHLHAWAPERTFK